MAVIGKLFISAFFLTQGNLYLNEWVGVVGEVLQLGSPADLTSCLCKSHSRTWQEHGPSGRAPSRWMDGHWILLPLPPPSHTDKTTTVLTSVSELVSRHCYKWPSTYWHVIHLSYLGKQHLLLSLYLLLLPRGHFLELWEGQLHTWNLHTHTHTQEQEHTLNVMQYGYRKGHVDKCVGLFTSAELQPWC